MEVQKVKCPYCGSLDLVQNTDGTYKCNDCGQTIKPDLKGQVSNIASGALSTGINIVQGATNESSEKRIIAAILAIVIGPLGAHFFYLKMFKEGVITLLINLIPVAGIIINIIRGIIFGIRALTSTNEAFYEKYCNG